MTKKKLIHDDLILEKALLVISEYGPERFTLAQVAEVVGLAPATLVQRFGSKNNLLILAAKHANVKLQQDLQELKRKNLNWDQELVHLLSTVPEGFGSRQQIANSLGVLKLDMVDPELHPIARLLFKTLRQRIHELLEEGRHSLQVEDVNGIAWEIDALRHGLVIQWTLSGEGMLEKWLKNGFEKYLKRLKK